jgi:hypothetical protein
MRVIMIFPGAENPPTEAEQAEAGVKRAELD